jgi:hypothetical protein
MNTLQPRSDTMPLMSIAVLAGQNRRFRGTDGISRESRSLGFAVAFRDSRTGGVYLSRFASGETAHAHVSTPAGKRPGQSPNRRTLNHERARGTVP